MRTAPVVFPALGAPSATLSAFGTHINPFGLFRLNMDKRFDFT
jgi:hypothetical protein